MAAVHDHAGRSEGARFSDLPVSVLRRVLSALPGPDALRTSGVSRRTALASRSAGLWAGLLASEFELGAERLAETAVLYALERAAPGDTVGQCIDETGPALDPSLGERRLGRAAPAMVVVEAGTPAPADIATAAAATPAPWDPRTAAAADCSAASAGASARRPDLGRPLVSDKRQVPKADADAARRRTALHALVLRRWYVAMLRQRLSPDERAFLMHPRRRDEWQACKRRSDATVFARGVVAVLIVGAAVASLSLALLGAGLAWDGSSSTTTVSLLVWPMAVVSGLAMAHVTLWSAVVCLGSLDAIGRRRPCPSDGGGGRCCDRDDGGAWSDAPPGTCRQCTRSHGDVAGSPLPCAVCVGQASDAMLCRLAAAGVPRRGCGTGLRGAGACNEACGERCHSVCGHAGGLCLGLAVKLGLAISAAGLSGTAVLLAARTSGMVGASSVSWFAAVLPAMAGCAVGVPTARFALGSIRYWRGGGRTPPNYGSAITAAVGGGVLAALMPFWALGADTGNRDLTATGIVPLLVFTGFVVACTAASSGNSSCREACLTLTVAGVVAAVWTSIWLPFQVVAGESDWSMTASAVPAVALIGLAGVIAPCITGRDLCFSARVRPSGEPALARLARGDAVAVDVPGSAEGRPVVLWI